MYQAVDHHTNVIVQVDLWVHHVKSLLVVFQASMNQVFLFIFLPSIQRQLEEAENQVY